MTLRSYLLFLAIGAITALTAAGIVLTAIDPVTASGTAFVALYVTLGAGFVGLFTIVGTVIRVSRNKNEEVGTAVARSIRQGAFFSLLLLVALYLSSRGMLNTFTAVLLVVFVTMVEFFFLIGKKDHGA